MQKRLGPAWCARGRPAAGFFTRRTAQAWLSEVLAQAQAGTLPGLRRSGATFADAAHEWLRYAREDRACKPSTMRDYRTAVEAHLLPTFGHLALEDVRADGIEGWRAQLSCSPRTKNKLLTVLNGIFRRAQRVYGLAANPVATIERLREPRRCDMEVFTPEEVLALVRAAAWRSGVSVRRVNPGQDDLCQPSRSELRWGWGRGVPRGLRSSEPTS
ncbi:MAG: N-terminal phage integrase SAM-like domain-containing protein [Actinomycetota bacterium]|nr:N-terminal phage integrase SAM-like domain-containing protein [Actinomycetota bacterium]